MGLEKTGRIGRIVDRPAQSRRRLRRGARDLLRAAAGARRLPHDRRRQDVGARPLRGREHRRLRPRDGPDQPADPLRRHLADRHQDVGPQERRAGQRPLRVARRRLDVEADHAPRPARAAAREDRGRRRAVRSAARLRADRDGAARLPLALRRRRRELEARQPQPALERAAALLHAHARHARQRQRGLLPLQRDGRDVRRRRDRRPDPLGRRQPRHVGGPEEPEPHDDRQRRRRLDLDDARKAVELHAPADRRRCTTSRPTTGSRTGSTARCRTTARCAGRASRRAAAASLRRSGPRRPAARPAGRRPIRWTRTSSGAAATPASWSASTRERGWRGR